MLETPYRNQRSETGICIFRLRERAVQEILHRDKAEVKLHFSQEVNGYLMKFSMLSIKFLRSEVSFSLICCNCCYRDREGVHCDNSPQPKFHSS